MGQVSALFTAISVIFIQDFWRPFNVVEQTAPFTRDACEQRGQGLRVPAQMRRLRRYSPHSVKRRRLRVSTTQSKARRLAIRPTCPARR